MIGKKAEEKSIASIHQVMDIIEERKKEGGELTYEQQRSYEHAKVLGISKEKGDKAKKRIEALGLLSEHTITKIVDIMPANQLLLKQILIKEGKTFTDEQLAKIMGAISGK
jgi:DNA-directed RNA polymerase subunit F